MWAVKFYFFTIFMLLGISLIGLILCFWVIIRDTPLSYKVLQWFNKFLYYPIAITLFASFILTLIYITFKTFV